MTPRTTYFKRFRMELDLRRELPPAALPEGFFWLPWHDGLAAAHADTKYQSFRDDLDAKVFPSLGHPVGCHDLIATIRSRAEFCQQATWLVATPDGCVGTVQGLCDRSRIGAVQNLGVVPGYRGMGLGEALLLKALRGFQLAGATRVYLEVTAQNAPAVRLYRKHGFRCTRTLYKGVAAPEPAAVGLGL